MYVVYILKCADEKLYIGYSTAIKNRIKRHCAGSVFSTKGRRPVNLIYFEAHLSIVDAKRREKYFKTTAGKKALKLMLRDCLSKSEQ